LESLAANLTSVLQGLGPTGAAFALFVIGFFDSSLLSLPEVNDLLIVYFCTHFKERAYQFAIAATLGSALGCSFLYSIARWKGYAFVTSRFSGARVRRTLRWFQRFGGFALVIPAIMPPPFPFKIFVLTAGITGLPLRSFVFAILIGRGIRYGVEAYFSVLYGERALRFIEANYTYILTLVLGGLFIGVAVSVVRRARRVSELSPSRQGATD